MTEYPPPPPPGNYPPPPPGNYPPPPPPGSGGPGGYGGAPASQPDNNLVWGILVTVLCCLPLGIVSIVKATQVSGLWGQGRYAEAQQAADDAKKFAMWGAIAGVVVGVIYLIFTLVVGASAFSYS
jgi:Interferon-induced transmembrane protein